MGRKHEVNNLDLWLSRYTHPGAQLAFEDGCCGRGLECTVGLLICIKFLISSKFWLEMEKREKPQNLIEKKYFNRFDLYIFWD